MVAPVLHQVGLSRSWSNPAIGYRKAAEIAKRELRENRSVPEIGIEMSDIDTSELQQLLDPAVLTPHNPQKIRITRLLI